MGFKNVQKKDVVSYISYVFLPRVQQTLYLISIQDFWKFGFAAHTFKEAYVFLSLCQFTKFTQWLFGVDEHFQSGI